MRMIFLFSDVNALIMLIQNYICMKTTPFLTNPIIELTMIIIAETIRLVLSKGRPFQIGIDSSNFLGVEAFGWCHIKCLSWGNSRDTEKDSNDEKNSGRVKSEWFRNGEMRQGNLCDFSYFYLPVMLQILWAVTTANCGGTCQWITSL